MSPGVRNSVLAVVISACMLATFYYLERAFRHGDTRRAIQAVQKSHTKAGSKTILEEMLQVYGPQARINWVGKTEDNFRGIMLVICELPDGKIRRFHVDLIHGTVTEVS